MITSDMQLLAQTAAERVLNSIPEGLAVAGVTWLVLRFMGRHNSGARFAVWFAALLAVIALPFVPHSSGSISVARAGTPFVLPASWGTGIVAVWLLIAGCAMARILSGLWNVRRLRKASLVIAEAKVVSALREVLDEIKTTRQVEVRGSDVVTVPTAVGFFRPMILLPAWAWKELSAQELRVVLFHEFAHLRRWDDWTNLAQKLIRTLFFFHPAVWWIERKLSLEREMACDDMVVAETENPRVYAECLVSLAERTAVRRGLALAQAVIGRAKETGLRLARILDGNRGTGTHPFRPALGMAAALGAMLAVAMPYRPNLVSFEPDVPAPAVMRASLTAPSLAASTLVPVAETASSRASLKLVRKIAARKSGEKLERIARPQPTGIEPTIPVMAREDESPAQQSQFVVVMQTTFDERGVTRRFSVWRVTIDQADPRVIHEELIVRSL